MLHNLPPLPPIKGEKGEDSKFPRASSASKYIQATNDEGKDYGFVIIILILWIIYYNILVGRKNMTLKTIHLWVF